MESTTANKKQIYTVVIEADRQQSDMLFNSLMHQLEITSVGLVTGIMKGNALQEENNNGYNRH